MPSAVGPPRAASVPTSAAPGGRRAVGSYHPQAWCDARHHAFHRLRGVSWWDPQPAQLQDGDYKAWWTTPVHQGAQPSLPTYYGWPTAGPSHDPLLLRTRQATLQGHVDWVHWTREAGGAIRRSRSIVPTFAFDDCCPNYGFAGPDGTIVWPSQPPWVDEESIPTGGAVSSEDVASPEYPTTMTTMLPEGGAATGVADDYEVESATNTLVSEPAHIGGVLWEMEQACGWMFKRGEGARNAHFDSTSAVTDEMHFQGPLWIDRAHRLEELRLRMRQTTAALERVVS